jgi:hypothetical protein
LRVVPCEPGPEGLPDATDPYALGAYWKKHFNTYLGKGRIIDAVGKYLRLAGKLGSMRRREND